MTRKGGCPMKFGFRKLISLTAAACMFFSLSFAESVPEVRSNAENSNWLAVTDHKMERKMNGKVIVTAQYPIYDIASHALQSPRIENHRKVLQSLQDESAMEREFTLKNLKETEQLIHQGYTNLIGNYFLTTIDISVMILPCSLSWNIAISMTFQEKESVWAL